MQILPKMLATITLSSLLLVACAEDEPGTITEEWSAYCTANFTEDHPVLSAFDKRIFTARVGEQYLITEFEESDGQLSASLAFLTSDGLYSFEIETDDSNPTLPFSTACEPDNNSEYYGVFKDVTFYATESLEQELCTLSAGSVLPRDSTAAGFSVTGGISLGGPQTYQVFLNAFSGQCGASSGFTKVPEVSVLGRQTNLVPVRWLIGPAPTL